MAKCTVDIKTLMKAIREFDPNLRLGSRGYTEADVIASRTDVDFFGLAQLEPVTPMGEAFVAYLTDRIR